MENKQTDNKWNEYRQNISQGWDHVPHPTNIENTITEKTNTQTNNTTWTDSEPVRWIASTTIVALFLYAMYALYKYELIVPTFFTIVCIWLVASTIILVKEAINMWLD